MIIPEGVTHIGKKAFERCFNLTSVIIPGSVKHIDEEAFQFCYGLSSVNIPEGVTHIGKNAFNNCRNLQSVKLPDTIKQIDEKAFADCIRLSSVRIPQGIDIMNEKAFHGCKKLVDKDGFLIVDDILFEYLGPGGDVVIPKGVKSISNYAFRECSNLRSVTIPDSVTHIGHYAFEECRSLTSVIIPKGVTYIGESAFCYCSSLISAAIPEKVTRIGKGAFYGCTHLECIRLPESVTYKPGGMITDHYAICYTVDTVFRVLFPVYLGGSIYNLPGKKHKKRALQGFFYAQEHGITEIDRWKDSYLTYIVDHIRKYMKQAERNRFVLMFLIREGLLDAEGVEYFWDKYRDTDDEEIKNALLQCRQNES